MHFAISSFMRMQLVNLLTTLKDTTLSRDVHSRCETAIKLLSELEAKPCS